MGISVAVGTGDRVGLDVAVAVHVKVGDGVWEGDISTVIDAVGV